MIMIMWRMRCWIEPSVDNCVSSQTVLIIECMLFIIYKIQRARERENH